MSSLHCLGLDASGIYRVGGKKPLVDQLQADFGKGKLKMKQQANTFEVVTCMLLVNVFFALQTA